MTTLNSRERTSKKQNKKSQQKTTVISSTTTQKPAIVKAKDKKANRAEMVVAKYNKIKTANSEVTKATATKTSGCKKASTTALINASVKDGLMSTTTGSVVGICGKAGRGKDNTPKDKTKSKRSIQKDDSLVGQQNQL